MTELLSSNMEERFDDYFTVHNSKALKIYISVICSGDGQATQASDQSPGVSQSMCHVSAEPRAPCQMSLQ